MKDEEIDLWVKPFQKEQWEAVAKKLDLTIWEYIRRATDAYSTILTQKEIFDK